LVMGLTVFWDPVSRASKFNYVFNLFWLMSHPQSQSAKDNKQRDTNLMIIPGCLHQNGFHLKVIC
jgi:hypothetical protein